MQDPNTPTDSSQDMADLPFNEWHLEGNDPGDTQTEVDNQNKKP